MQIDPKLERLQAALLAALEQEGGSRSSEWRRLSDRLGEIEAAVFDPSTGDELQRLIESLPAGAVDIEAELLDVVDSDGEADGLIADSSPWAGGRRGARGGGPGKPPIGRFIEALAELAERRRTSARRPALGGWGPADEELVTERRRRINSALRSDWQDSRGQASPVEKPKVLVLADDDERVRANAGKTGSGEPTPKDGQES